MWGRSSIPGRALRWEPSEGNTGLFSIPTWGLGAEGGKEDPMETACGTARVRAPNEGVQPLVEPALVFVDLPFEAAEIRAGVRAKHRLLLYIVGRLPPNKQRWRMMGHNSAELAS